MIIVNHNKKSNYSKVTDSAQNSSPPLNIQRRFKTDADIFEEMLRKHCNFEFGKGSSEEIVNSSLSAVMIAFDEYLKQVKVD